MQWDDYFMDVIMMKIIFEGKESIKRRNLAWQQETCQCIKDYFPKLALCALTTHFTVKVVIMVYWPALKIIVVDYIYNFDYFPFAPSKFYYEILNDS